MLWAGTDEIVRRLAAGETLDVVIAPSPWIDDLTGRGWLVPGGRVDLAENSGIGVAIKSGLPPIDIGSTEALRGAFRKAHKIMLSEGVSGIYLTALQEMGPCRRARAQDRAAAGLIRGLSGRDGARRGGHRLPAGGGMARGQRGDLRRAVARRRRE